MIMIPGAAYLPSHLQDLVLRKTITWRVMLAMMNEANAETSQRGGLQPRPALQGQTAAMARLCKEPVIRGLTVPRTRRMGVLEAKSRGRETRMNRPCVEDCHCTMARMS